MARTYTLKDICPFKKYRGQNLPMEAVIERDTSYIRYLVMSGYILLDNQAYDLFRVCVEEQGLDETGDKAP